MKQCEKCQTENNDEAAYCKSCGHILEMGKTNLVVKFQSTFSKRNIIVVWSYRILIFAIPLFITAFILTFYFDYFIGANMFYEGVIEKKYHTEYNKISNLIPNNDLYNSYEWDDTDACDKLINYVGHAKAEPLIKLIKEYRNAEIKWDLFMILSIIFGILLSGSLPFYFVFLFIYNKRWKKFHLNSDFKNAQERLTAFAFSQNTSAETIKIRENSKDELRLKDKSLGVKGYFHLVTNKEGNVLLIGEKYNTQNLIRTVFGKEINFLETK